MEKFEGYYDYDEVYYGMLNSYEMVVYNVTLSDVLVKDVEFFIHDITKPITVDVVDDLIQYFEDMEDYEKCKILLEKRKEYDTI